MTTPEQEYYREMCSLQKEVERLREVVNSNSSLLKIYSIACERDEAVSEVKRLRALAAQHLT